MIKDLFKKLPFLWVFVVLLSPLIFSLILPFAILHSIFSYFILDKTVAAWLASILSLIFLIWILHGILNGTIIFSDTGCIGRSGNWSNNC